MTLQEPPSLKAGVKAQVDTSRYVERSKEVGKVLAAQKITNIPLTGATISDIERQITKVRGSIVKKDFTFGDTPVCVLNWDTGSGVYIPHAIVYVQKGGTWYLVHAGGSKAGNWFMDFRKVDEATLGIFEAARETKKGIDPFRLVKKVQVVF